MLPDITRSVRSRSVYARCAWQEYKCWPCHPAGKARYYDGSKGQFLSGDPTFWAIGTPKLAEILNRVNGTNGTRPGSGKQMSERQALERLLSDPQLLNSYAYGRGNPIVNGDPTGEVIPLAPILLAYGIAQLAVDSWDAYNINIKYASVTTPEQKS